MQPRKYATLEQMQNMEFGGVGYVVVKDGIEYEYLEDAEGEYYGWAAKHGVGQDWNGDWDRVAEEDVPYIFAKSEW